MAKTKKSVHSSPVLIDGHVSSEQCALAVEALHQHFGKQEKAREETDLLPVKEQHIWLNLTVKKIASAHRFKPIKIPITHPIVDPRVEAVCLLTKDPQRKYKDLLEEHGIKFISRVVGIEKLKGKFKPFEARRQLLKHNGLFLADERIVPLLPKLLGVKWFEAKKPIPVCLTRKDLKAELERAISSTYMNQNQGTCTAIKIAKLPTHTPAQTIANLTRALPAAVNAIKGGWENVQSLLLKTNSSPGLPIWSCDLGESRWVGLEEKMEESEIKEVQAGGATKGKKRAADSDGDEVRSVKTGAVGIDQPNEGVETKPKKKKAKYLDDSLPSKRQSPDSQVDVRISSTKITTKKESTEKTKKRAEQKEDVQLPDTQVDARISSSKVSTKKQSTEQEKKKAEPKQPNDDVPPPDTLGISSNKISTKKESTEKVKRRAESKLPEAKQQNDDVQPPPPIATTSTDLKQKRHGERKKEVIVGGKGKRSKNVKNSVIGRKAGQ
ncbi:hypothetical protein MIND_00601000 [Mycena indigotica]|uniref:Ribosomal protein L1 n=1 Tax=Mycena indigotica TaxID=2126181 RepID=A0A8H6SS58_9AGAR|nr:uncharacterized protein MIND_00601000 [Mycena indigotica]KAF7303716.1 hypothetical protein MIND_00601000 [Mycena indigotica]